MFYRFIARVTATSGLSPGSLICLYSSPVFTPNPLNYAWMSATPSEDKDSECSLWIYSPERVRMASSIKVFTNVPLFITVHGRCNAETGKLSAPDGLQGRSHDLGAVDSVDAYVEQGSGKLMVAELEHGRGSKSDLVLKFTARDVIMRSTASITITLNQCNIVVKDPPGMTGWTLRAWLADHVCESDVSAWQESAATPLNHQLLEKCAYDKNDAVEVASHTLLGLVKQDKLRVSRILGFLRYSTYSYISETPDSDTSPIPVWAQVLWPSKSISCPPSDDRYLEMSIVQILRLFGHSDSKAFIDNPLAHPGPEVFAQICGWLPGMTHYIGDVTMSGEACDQFSHVSSFLLPGRNGKDCEDGAMALHDMAARLHLRARRELLEPNGQNKTTSELVRALLWVALCYIVLTHDCVASTGRTTRKGKGGESKRGSGVARTSERHQLTAALCREKISPTKARDIDDELEAILAGGDSGDETKKPDDEWAHVEKFDNPVALHSLCRIYPVDILSKLTHPGQIESVTSGGARIGATSTRFADDGLCHKFLAELSKSIQTALPDKWKRTYAGLEVLHTESTDGFIATPRQDDWIARELNSVLGEGLPTVRTLNSIRSYQEDGFIRIILRSYSSILFLATGHPTLMGFDNSGGVDFDIGWRAMPCGDAIVHHLFSSCCLIPCPKPTSQEMTVALAHWFSRPWPRTINASDSNDLVPMRISGENTVLFLLSNGISLEHIKDKYKISEPAPVSIAKGHSVQAVSITPKRKIENK